MAINKKDHSSNIAQTDRPITLSEILLILARNIKLIILVPTIFCIFTIINVFFFVQPLYMSSTKIISSSGENRVSQAAGLAAQFGITIPNSGSEPKWAYPEIIKSRTIANLMLEMKFDSDEFGKQKTLSFILSSGDLSNQTESIKKRSQLAKNFISMISVAEDLKTSILTVSITSKEAILAAEINKALIYQLDQHQRKYNKAKTTETKKFIEGRVLDIEKELNIAENKLRDFTSSNRRIDNSALLLLEQQRLMREVDVLMSIFTTLKQQLETTKIEEVRESNYVTVIDYPEIPIYPINGNKKLKVIIAGFFGIGLGVIFSFLKEYFIILKRNEKEGLSNAKELFVENLVAILPKKSSKTIK